MRAKTICSLSGGRTTKIECHILIKYVYLIFRALNIEYIEYSICQLRKKCQRYRNCERNKVFPSLNGFALKRFVEWLVQAKWKCEKKIWMHFYIYLFPLQIQKANRQEKKAINCIIPSKCGFVNLKKRKISQNRFEILLMKTTHWMIKLMEYTGLWVSKIILTFSSERGNKWQMCSSLLLSSYR